MRSAITIFLLIALTITSGCALTRPKPMIHDVSTYAGPGDRVELLPPSQRHSVRVASTARRVGEMTTADWSEIVSLTGRLPGLSDEERTIKWVWCYGTPTATIRLALGEYKDHTEVTFIRNDGKWVLGWIAWVIVD